MAARDDPGRLIATSRTDWRRAREDRRMRRERRRRALRRRRVICLTLILVALAAGLSVIANVSGGSTAARPSIVVSGLRSVPARAQAPRPHRRAHPAASSPGSLPQTHAYPSGGSAQFKSLMASLWAGVVKGSLAPAVRAFFPKGAYVQLKAIPSAGSDWTNRLVHDYGLDIAAAHSLLGRDAAHAQLIKVEVHSNYGHWIPPGVCYNSIGYYEMPNARVVYREAGRIRSLGIASMISWRGVWYVVHLGAILRSSDSGTVDEPASGPGVSAYSGTC